MSNLVTALGVLIILAAVAALTDWRWALLGLGVVLVAAGYAMWTHERQQARTTGGRGS